MQPASDHPILLSHILLNLIGFMQKKQRQAKNSGSAVSEIADRQL